MCEYTYGSKLPQLSLTTLMNYVTFGPNSDIELDANFISVRDKSGDKTIYYVQRLIGVPIQNEKAPETGKIWIVYINSKKMIWNDIAECDTKVTPQCKIIWIYQMINETLV